MFTIFAMSANTSSEDISNAINSGMNGHLDKPINVDKLYQTIAQVISKEQTKTVTNQEFIS